MDPYTSPGHSASALPLPPPPSGYQQAPPPPPAPVQAFPTKSVASGIVAVLFTIGSILGGVNSLIPDHNEKFERIDTRLEAVEKSQEREADAHAKAAATQREIKDYLEKQFDKLGDRVESLEEYRNSSKRYHETVDRRFQDQASWERDVTDRLNRMSRKLYTNENL